MSWQERAGEDEFHKVHVLLNDAGALLARIEGFGDRWYVWAACRENPGFLRRQGASGATTEAEAKAHAEEVVMGDVEQAKGTAVEDRQSAYRGKPLR